jgi:hypothetical protein
MKLLHDIISQSTDDDIALVSLLRKCLVLAHELSSDTLRLWATNELNGYPDYMNMPKYRVASITARGMLLGPFGAQINNQPLAASVMKKDHRWWATTAYLNEPIASYERLISEADLDGSLTINWPADMTAHYQSSFIQGYALNRAWQEISLGAVVAAVDAVRTKMLELALELQREMGSSGNSEAKPAPAVVDQAAHTIIYGGTNIVASNVGGNIQFIGQQIVTQGDFPSLKSALTEIGVIQEDIAALEQAIEHDKAEGAPDGFGKRVAAWLKKSGSLVGKEGAKAISAEAGKAVATAALTFFGVGS